MELNYSSIKDEEERKTVIRFQEWAMRVLGDAVKTVQKGEKNLLEIPYPEADIDYIRPEEAAEMLGKSYRTVMRYIKKRKLKAFRLLNGFLLDRDEVKRLKTLMEFRKR